MKSIEEVLDEGRKICIELRDKIVKELPELDMTYSNIQDSIFDETECCAVLGLPEFYCCGEQCNFEVDLAIEENSIGKQVVNCSAYISGLNSFNSYFSDTYEMFNYDDIDKIVNAFFVIIADWTKNIKNKSYMVAFNNPILKDSDCIATKVFDTMQGNISINDIKKYNRYLPKHIVACDSISIVDGAIDQIAVIFSAGVTDDSPDTSATVLAFRGFSNFTDRAKAIIKRDSEADGESFKIIGLTDGETINDLPIDIYAKLRFCSDQLGIDSTKYAGYTECNSLSDFLLDDCGAAYGYSAAVIVNGEPSIQC